ncbi:hypothetical protein [Kutzneria sp. CA-103260]|uniref:hypothetical protein n=1 Tax=Kutzneria sp. CA-103260 TaxID=2802641 RepID=UPI001BA63EF5|nr:hypothetical protein [Kutzneria sp. CA-103260]QUQ65644.1 Carboxypeptidase regulatory-like domain protein [Kutzneria sp. CA-103260]
MTEYRTLTAARVFDVVDGFARQRGLAGARPRLISPVRIFLLADHTPGAQRTFAEPPELVLASTAHGYTVNFGLLSQPDGRQQKTAFGAGPYLLRVRADHYQVADFDNVFLPATHDQPEPFEMVLEAGYSYPFPTASTPPPVQIGGTVSTALALLRGATLHPDGSGVVDAVVTAPGATSYRTDTDGQWVLVFADGVPATDLVTVTITAPGADPVAIPDVPVTPAGEAVLPQTAVRGRIRAAGVDPRKVVVSVGGVAAGVRADGVWAFYFPPTQPATTVTVTATLPDGRTQSATGVAVAPRTTTTVPDFSFPRPDHSLRSTDA